MAARELIGAGADATVIAQPDGSPQVKFLVWVALQSTPDGDEACHGALLAEHKKVRATSVAIPGWR